MAGLPVEAVRGAAVRAGLRVGDVIVAVDGRPAVDALDLSAAAADEAFTVTVLRDGEEHDLALDLECGEGHGVTLTGGLGTPVRRCRNDCRFCFIDQVPAGLRPSLRVKDDDYRLSFLHGTFITLTNMDDDDLARVERLRLSPLFVSLHDWDDERRARLMGEPARASRDKLLRLARAGIELHVQVVLCPGWNDGPALTETLAGLLAVSGVADVGVVPVSLASEGELRRVGPDDSARAITLVETVQRDALRRRGVRFAHAADELYLLAGRRPPTSDAELQYENGVGLVAATLAESVRCSLPTGARRFAMLTGTLALPVMQELCERLASRHGAVQTSHGAAEPQLGAGATAPSPARHDTATGGADERERLEIRDRPRERAGGPRVRPYVVRNELFGPHITVTGLLGGRDVLRTLREQPLDDDEWLLAPAAFLPPELGVTLDDVPLDELRSACRGRFAVGEGPAAAFAQVHPS